MPVDLQLLESSRSALAQTTTNISDNFEKNAEGSLIRAQPKVIIGPDKERLNDLLKTMSREADKKRREKNNNLPESGAKKSFCDTCKKETGSEDNLNTHKMGTGHRRKVNDSQMLAKYLEAPLGKPMRKPKKK